MLTDSLVSNQGPLSNIWLAANYDKKLTKQQLLSTNIVESTEYISSYNQHEHLHESGQRKKTETDTITLRLSGQLLLGIVKIYSRKTKYLLDDVNDILYKLKASFKLSSGVQLGSDSIIASNRINLPPNQTTLADINAVTLQDQVSVFDLLYQEDLDLNSNEHEPVNNLATVFTSVGQNNDTQDTSFNQSIEYGRGMDHNDDTSHNSFNDMELDFDLNLDDNQSIEQGRNASILGQEEVGRGEGGVNNDDELSFLAELNKSRNIFELESGQPIININEEEVEEAGEEEERRRGEGDIALQNQAFSQSSIRRQKRNRITEEGEMIIPNRKLVVDSEENMGGMSVQLLKDNQELLMSSSKEHYITLRLSEDEKLKLIQELAQPPFFSKRRKLCNLDTQLQLRCMELAQSKEKKNEENDDNEEEGKSDKEDDDESNASNGSASETEDTSFDSSMDLDLSLDVDSDESVRSNTDDEDETDFNGEMSRRTARSTKQITKELQNQFRVSSTVTFNTLMEADMKSQNPIGMKHGKYLNAKREGARCFFELLVLATNECITLQQEQCDTEVSKDVNISSKDKLYNFL